MKDETTPQDRQFTPLELELIKASQREFVAGYHGTGHSARSFEGDDCYVSAKLIEDLARGVFQHPDFPDWTPKSKSLSLWGAIVLGPMNFLNKRVITALEFGECKFRNTLMMARAQIDGSLTFKSCNLEAGLTLTEAKIAGILTVSKTSVQSKISASSVEACGLVLTDGMFGSQVDFTNASISGNVSSWQSKFTCGFTLRDARVNGSVVLTSSTFGSPDGEKVRLDLAKLKAQDLVGPKIKLYGELVANECELQGGVNLLQAEISGRNGTSVRLNLAQVGTGIFIRGATFGAFFNADAVRADWLNARDVKFLGSPDGAACFTSARFETSMNFSGSRFEGMLNLTNARAGSVLDLGNAQLKATSGTSHVLSEPNKNLSTSFDLGKAVSLARAEIGGLLKMPDQQPIGVVDLLHARCDVLEDFRKGWPSPGNLLLAGFDFTMFANVVAVPDTESPASSKYISEARSEWLKLQPESGLRQSFNPQPWRQVARVLHDMGHDHAAQRISIERRIQERRAKSTPLGQKLISLMLHGVADYGHNPWKTVVVCVALIAAFALVFLGLDRACLPEALACDGPLFMQARVGDVNSEYPTLSYALLSLDGFVPILDFGYASFWSPNPDAIVTVKGTPLPLGKAVFWLQVFERIIGAIMLAIAITGFTGLLARESS